MVEQSYRRLDDWSKMQLDSTSSDHSGKEQDYIDHFKHYIKRMCDAKAQVTQRLQNMKETQAYLRKSNEQARKHYNQSLDMDNHIERCQQRIESDEAMNKSMESAILESMDKAQKMVSPRLFDEFIRQISMDRAGNYIDLSRYKPQPMPRTTVSTQTNLNRQRHPPPRSVLPQQRVHQQYGHRAAAQMQGQQRAVAQGVRRSHPQSQPLNQQQHAAPPRSMNQQQHAAPHRAVQQRQRQSLPRTAVQQQAMNGAVNHQQNRQNLQNHPNRSNVSVHGQAMGQRAPQQMHSQAMGRKPARPPMPMNKGTQNGQSQQQMMQMMMNNVNGQQAQGMRGASKPPVPSSRGRGHAVNVSHYSQQQAAAQNAESSQQVQGQQAQQQSQPAPQGQRRRAPMVNGQGNQVNMQQPYRQYE